MLNFADEQYGFPFGRSTIAIFISLQRLFEDYLGDRVIACADSRSTRCQQGLVLGPLSCNLGNDWMLQKIVCRKPTAACYESSVTDDTAHHILSDLSLIGDSV